MIDELGEATSALDRALMLLRQERDAWGRGFAGDAMKAHYDATEVLGSLHADIVAWRCILIVAQRSRARSRDRWPSLIGRVLRRLHATL